MLTDTESKEVVELIDDYKLDSAKKKIHNALDKGIKMKMDEMMKKVMKEKMKAIEMEDEGDTDDMDEMRHDKKYGD